jgi:tetratricopeptide (TPR) repeat protein
VWARRLHCLAWITLAAAGAGCSMMPQMLEAPPSPQEGKAPTARITQADVVALNDAVAGLARTEDPKRYEEASTKLANLLPRFEAANENSYAAEAMFWLAFCYEKTGRKENAAIFYDQLVRRYPQARAAEEAKARRQRLEFKRPPEPGAPAPAP